MRYAVLVVVGGTLGFLLGRYLIPVVLGNGVLLFFVVLVLILAAAALVARRVRRGRSGS